MSFKRLSVVIPNYNYGRFIGDAISSALNIDWPDIEVIVVDDGSTDNSREVIASHGSRIKALFQANQGQVGACNTGFAASTGDAVMFLDSDDFVDRGVAQEAAQVWTPDVSKVQFQMRSVRADGTPMGSCLPQYHVHPSARQIRRWVLTTSAYPTPPGSGNVYARSYLEKIFPLSEIAGRAADSCCIAAAPLLGDVVTVRKPLVSYRIHGSNDGAFLALDEGRFAREIARASKLFEYSRQVATRAGLAMDPKVIRWSLTLLPYRIACGKLAPATHPWADDGAFQQCIDLMQGLRLPQGMGWKGQAALCVWSIATLLAPRPLARKLILWRFSASSRPRALLKTMQLLGVMR